MSLVKTDRPNVFSTIPKPVYIGAISVLMLGAISTYMAIRPGQATKPIPTVRVKYGSINPYVSATGTIGNHESVSISSSTGGQIVKWLVREGSNVKAGQPLAYFSDYSLNQKIYEGLRQRYLAAEQAVADNQEGQTLDEQQSASDATISQDKANVTQSLEQWKAAQVALQDAKQSYRLAQKVDPQTLAANQEDYDKAETAVAVDKALLKQAQTKLSSDERIEATDPTIKMDGVAVSVAQAQLAAAQQEANATQQQLSTNVNASDQSKQEAVQAAKQALDQANSQVSVAQSALSEAQTKLSSDESPQTNSSVLQQDQGNLAVLQQELANAQQKLNADLSPQETASTIQQDKSALAMYQQELTNAENQLSTDQAVYGQSSAQLQADQAAVNLYQTEVNDAQAQLTTDEQQPASNATIEQDKENIQQLQQQVSAATAQLNTDRSQTATAAQIQEDEAAINVANQQLQAAQAVAKDDQIAYQQALSNNASVSVSAIQTALAQAQGNVSIYQSQLKQAEAKLNGDRASAQSQSELRQDQSAVSVAQEQLKAAQILGKDAKQVSLDSNRPSASALLNAKINLDQAQGTEQVQQAALQAARLKLAIDQSPLDKRELLSVSEATLQAKQTAVQAKLDMLNALQTVRNSELTAPANGEVVSVDVPTGTELAPNQEACTLLPSDERAQVIALVNADDVKQVQVGQHVSITSQDFNGTEEGTVSFVSPLPANSSQGSDSYQYPVYIQFDHPSAQTTNGMSVNCDIYTKRIQHVAIVPANAVMTNNDKLGVYVKSKSGAFKFTPVKVVSSDESNVQIRGVKVGTVVATKRPQG
ncbi:HlyD family efflux transporter periplasmic adaptor subunit [Alicyclobacillus acidiphilus]|uniref:HlyD family efflux transporter periplasmic adaptor subunit n=1 Tax=Alicyclobacillus acidiphilus TaxID=182455 RepID=UPI00082E5732|nr:HlyD family efflux transporter periplasmic adaptor subunit [Alicyclobacillus acidiphilus]